MKCILNVIYTLKNVFKHLCGHFPAIFHHIIMFKAFFKNRDFLKILDFLGFLGIFARVNFGCKKAQKLSKMFEICENVFFRSQR